MEQLMMNRKYMKTLLLTEACKLFLNVNIL